MKLYGFGSTVAGCYVFSQIDAEDDWTLTRDPVAASVGGRDGAADFYQQDNYPIKPLTISKTFTVLPNLGPFAGTGHIILPAPENVIDGDGTTKFLTELFPGDYLNVGSDALLISDVQDDYSATTDTAHSDHSEEAFTITSARPHDVNYSRLDIALNALRLATIAQDETKLWAKMRDGSYRWCWAKCVSPSAPENTSTRLDIPVTIEFFCREGLWYNETAHTTTKTAAGAIAIANAGNYPAAVACDLTAGNAAVTAFSLTTSNQAWAFSGTLAATKHLIVSPAAYSATNNSANAYASLTITDKSNLWLYLPPAVMYVNSTTPYTTITSAITGGGTGWTFTLTWYDTWIM